MEGDKTADNEKELTSTSSSDMDKLLSTNNEEKNESNDTLPTSSTDASTSVKSTHLVSDDPISSTSSEMDTAKSKAAEKTSMGVAEKASTFENDVEMLGMSMTRQPTEQIEENVDDLVSDLETLLGESTASFSLPFKAAEVQDKTEVTSAIEDNQQDIPKNKFENEVSSNTDSSSEKPVNYGEPAIVPVEKSEGERIQDEFSVIVEEAAKDIGGSNEFETSTDSSAVKDSTEEPEKLEVPEDLKEPNSDNTQNVRESSDDLLERDKKQLVNTNESDLKANSEECIDDTSPKAAKDDNEETCKDNENITVQDDVKKSDQIISREAVGALTTNAEAPENSCQNQETTGSIPTEESVMEGSPQNTESEHVEQQPIEANQSKEYLENLVDENPDNNLKDVQVPSDEIAEVMMEPEEPSTICVQTKESHELTEVISAETVPSNETQDPCQENPESESANTSKQEDNLQLYKADIEATKNENVELEKLNSSIEVENVQSFDDKESISHQAIELVQENNDGVEDVNESIKCASTEDIQVLEEKTEVYDAIEIGDVINAEEKQIKETINTDENIEPTETENGSKQSEDTHDLNTLPESSTMIMEEENVHIQEKNGALCDVNNELETENKKDEVSGNIDMSETADIEKTTAIETTEISKECNIEIEDAEKCIKSKSKESDEISETEVNEKSAPTDKSQPHPQVQTIDYPLEEEQAEIPKTLSESQEDYCKSVKCAANVSSPEPVKSSLENPQESPSEQTEIPQCVKESQPIHETEEPCQDNQNLPEEIEISELANTTTGADSLKPVVEPEENVDSARVEIMEITKDENKVPAITEDLEYNQEDRIEIIQKEKIDKDTTCFKPENVAAEISQYSPENSDEVITAAEVEVIKSAEENVTEHIKEDIVVAHLNFEAQGNDTNSIITKETEDQMDVSDVSIQLESLESNSGTQKITVDEDKIEGDEKSSIPVSKLCDEVDESINVLKDPKEIDSTIEEETQILEIKIDRQEADCVGGNLTEEKSDKLLVKESMEGIDESLREATDCQQVAEQNRDAVNIDLQKSDPKEVLSDTDVEACVKQNDTDILKHESHSEKSATIEEVMHEKKTEEMVTKTELQEKVIGVTEGLENLITANLCKEEQNLLTPTLPKEGISLIPIDTDANEGKKVTKKMEIFAQHIEEIKPIPEINIRRKTVEQDLEKVVCLSEESSSDSDTSEETDNRVPKLTDDNKEADFEQDSLMYDVPLADDLPPNQEENDLIEIARKVEQLQKVETIRPIASEIRSEESTPVIVDILSNQHPINTEENLETILAVASLQNDPVCELKAERRLSEKELREMEAIRMAVASITDSSQDTYDSYLVESSMTMENSIPEVSSDIQEFSSDVQELSSDTQLSNDVQELCDDTQILAESVAQEDTMMPKDDLETHPKSENRKDSKDVTNEEASNTKEVGKTDMTETEVSDIKTNITEVSDVKTDKPEVTDVKTDITEVSDVKTDITEVGDVKTDITSDVKTDITSDVKTEITRDVKMDITEVNDVKTDIAETEVCDVKTSDNLADDNDHPTSNDKDVEQIEYSTELKEGLAIDESREQADTDDIGEQNKALVPEQAYKESEKSEVSLPKQVPHIEDSVSGQVVDSNESPEIPSVDRKESLECEDDIAIAVKNTVASEQVVIEEKVTAPQLVVKDQEIPISKIDAEEKKDTILEPIVEKQEISKSEECVKEAATPPIVDEGRISESLQVDQEKEDTLPEPVEEKKNFASKQVIKEKDIDPPKQAIEEKKVVASEQVIKERKVSEHIAQANEVSTPQQAVEERTLRNRTRRGNKVSEPLSISVEEVEKKEKPYSPKITIKPVKVPDEEVSTTSDAEGNKGSLKITITKQSAKMHSILKVYNPDDDPEPLINQEEPIPKLIIKPKMQQVEQQHSPKMSTRSSKVYSPTSTQRCSSPRITIKPVVKPVESKPDVISPLKITFKPVIKPDEGGKKHSPKALKELEQKNHSPKITIKPIPKPVESEREETIVSTPKVTIKPIKRHIEDSEAENDQERSSPKITIKPVVKPAEQDGEHANQTMPKLKIKPIKKHEDEENTLTEKDRDSPKISIKPIVKPVEIEEEDEEVKERIVLKINKGNLPTPSKDSRKREYPEDEKTEKIGKLKLKFSTTGGQTHIVQEVEDSCKRQRKDSGYSGKKDPEEVSNKRTLEDKLLEKNKRLRSSLTPDKVNEGGNDDPKIHGHKLDSPIVISEDSRSQHSGDCVTLDDFQSNSSDISKIADIASRTTHIEASPVVTVGVVTPSLSPAPKRRGRPRKVPLEVREEHKDPLATPPLTPQVTPQSTPPVAETSSTMPEKSEPSTPVTTPSPGGRPKRSCRGQNVIATLGIKPRKPRGRGSGRGGKVNMGDREPVVQTSEGPVQTVAMKPEKEPKLTKAKLKLIQKAAEEEAKRQKEDAIKKEKEEAEKVRQREEEEEKIKKQEEQALKQQEEELKKINLELQTKQEEEVRLKKQEEEEKQQKLAQKIIEEGEKRKVIEEQKRSLEVENEKKQKALKEEAKRLEIVDKEQKELEEELNKQRQKELEEHKILEAAETARKLKEDTLKRKKEGESQTPPKKKKEDKTPPRKLEVTTRRQKAQLQKAAEEAKRVADAQDGAGEAKTPVGASRNTEKLTEASSSENNTISNTVIVLSDENSSEIKEADKKIEERDKPKEKGKKSPEQKGKGKVTPEKARKLLEKAKLEEEKRAEEAREAEEQAKAYEQKKIEEQEKAEQERKAEEERRVAEEKIELQKKELEQKELEKKELEQKELEKKELEQKELEKKELEQKELEKKELEQKELEKIALEQKKVEQHKKEQENEADDKKEDISADDKKPDDETAGDKKSEEVSAEEDEESEDSEGEKQRELVRQKKQEAIKKCRAKRMEKRAKAAEVKRKRQEQAAQQRAARIAAEEAERIAAEKSKINRRYGRYGNPKPQISLIDEPVRETEGTVKSHMGLFDPQTDKLTITQPIEIDDDSNFAGTQQGADKPSTSAQKLLAPPTPEPMAVDSTEETPTKHSRPIGSEDVMMVDEETRMSADFRGSRAQTPAKQSIPPPETIIEDSQGSIGTESVGGKSKSSKTPKMEVFQDLEATQVSAEQLAEYSWNGRGPFMIQEQVALFLGIKSFKRKYPNCQRRSVDMQERDYLKENGFVTEAQCDLGLTAVNAQDILDIMYADFQDKYEDYCKVQREKQARELANKQKALSQFTFKPGYEKLDIIEQAVQSAAAWNQQFNKTRREERKAHMDLQNLTVHYPKSKMKPVPVTKVGDHPIALVPGQFTDYYKEFTPTELNNLPLNTMCYDEIKVPGAESESDESSSGSDSDSDSSSDSSSSDSSCDEDCKECDKHGNAEVNENDGNDVSMDNTGSNDSVVLVSVTTAAPVSA